MGENIEENRRAVRRRMARPLGIAVLVLVLAVVLVWGINRYEGGPVLGPISDFLVVLASLHLLLFWMVRGGSKFGYWLYRLECLVFGLLIPGAVGQRCRKVAAQLRDREVKSAFGKR